MLEVLRDDKNNIKACCEWYLVNINGEYDPKGDMVWVNEVEVSKDFKGYKLFQEFARIIMTKCPQAMFAYFWRKTKYPNRKPKIYHKVQWLKLIGG